MSEFKKAIDREVAELKTLRDELKLQAHLAKGEAKKAWDKLESQWPDLDTKVDELEKASKDAVEQVGSRLKSMMKDLKSGYQSLKKD
jgi:chaperonin cofactor prefoldin